VNIVAYHVSGDKPPLSAAGELGAFSLAVAQSSFQPLGRGAHIVYGSRLHPRPTVWPCRNLHKTLKCVYT